MSAKAWSSDYHTTTVCIDSYHNGVPVGRFYPSGSEAGCDFQSLTQFLMQMERAMDETERPKSFTETRTFAPAPPAQPGKANIRSSTGAVATFAVRILFRQNTSWQGSVAWLEGRQEKSFRSVLELILLIDNALSCAKSA